MSESSKSSEDRAVTAVELLHDFYEPATSIPESKMFMTTEQVIEFVRGIMPHLDPDPMTIFDALEKKGYKYDLVSPGNLRWMLK